MPEPQGTDVTPNTLLFSVKTTAEVLGISMFMARKLISTEELPSRMIGGRRYVAAQAVRDYADKIARQA